MNSIAPHHTSLVPGDLSGSSLDLVEALLRPGMPRTTIADLLEGLLYEASALVEDRAKLLRGVPLATPEEVGRSEASPGGSEAPPLPPSFHLRSLLHSFNDVEDIAAVRAVLLAAVDIIDHHAALTQDAMDEASWSNDFDAIDAAGMDLHAEQRSNREPLPEPSPSAQRAGSLMAAALHCAGDDEAFRRLGGFMVGDPSFGPFVLRVAPDAVRDHQ